MNIEKLQFPENPNVFFSWLKKLSEKVWENIEPREGIFGFQTQKETKWIEGLSEEEIEEYESELGFLFPEIYKTYLRNMNGTDKPAINFYGNGESIAYAPNYYSFPRDLEIVKDRVQWIYKEFLVDEEEVQRENIPHIIPIVSHRFLIADNCAKNPILSMHGRDSILYAPSLESFLVADIFRNHSIVTTDSEFQIKLWLDEDLEYLNA
ncbi:MAG: hypothetical protein H0X15_09145 [Acidobacteria bacterium]|nr:hypothetical protein [Acidobacteriota bacterium]